MQTGSGAKNPPWARSNVNTNIAGMNPQLMDPNMMGQQGLMPFQQTQTVFNPSMMQPQGGMPMPMGGQMPMNQMAQGQMYPGNVVAYPTPRAMNAGMYQNNQGSQPAATNEQRVFTGTVTKTHNDFGFVDHDVFYQTSVCAKGIVPKVNDRVLVEATYNPNMPFKWNATRVQVLPKGGPKQKQNTPKTNNYNAVPPPQGGKKNLPMRRDNRENRESSRDDRERPLRRDDRADRKRSRSKSRSRSRDRRDSRNRRDSPPRKRPVAHQPSPVKYVVRVPRMPLDIEKLDVPGLTQRYSNLYIPSDFFNAQVKWGETFPPQNPFSLNNPCAYHIMSKDAENPNPHDAVLEPSDADYRYSAKVMLISMPALETLYQKCGLTKSDDKEKRSSKSPLHPTRLIKFLVGQKGKGGENFAIGGPWSPSLDGENPQSDPAVLVKTAIRTCKALTGIDLSSCTQWYRMVEFYYWRESSGGKGRLECVVLFLPDAWSVQPSRLEWGTLQDQYKAAADAALRKLDEPDTPKTDSQIKPADANDSTITIDENDDDDDDKPEPTHYSKIDLRTIKVDQLRQELRARNVSCKGLRAQLVSRLSKLIKTEEEKDSKGEENMVVENDDDKPAEIKEDKQQTENKQEQEKIEEETITEQDKKDEKVENPKPTKTEKEIEEEKKKLEKEKHAIKTRHELPSTPHIIVHPNTAAKGGKFTCNSATLSLLLDYRMTDNKEHSFELFVFAELFNEMLMRDFGFYIYKTLYTLPEKAEEIKEVKEKDKSVEKSDKKDEKKSDGDKKDEKKDSRDSRKRDRRDSHSDDERTSSPRRKSRGVELPPDPYLLMSLVYFDTSRNLSIIKKDLQNLFMSLGLQLSRSQIKSILEKVCVKDSFSYKSLAQAIRDLSLGTGDVMQDLPLDGIVSTNEIQPQIAELELAIASGNRELLPLFNRPSQGEFSSSETKDVSDSGVVVYKSRVVDVGALVASEARGLAVRTRLEAALEAARGALKTARASAAATQQAERGATAQLRDLNAHLAAARARITSLTASAKIFHSALKTIQAKTDAVINIKFEDDDVVEIPNGPSKTEKDLPKEKSEQKLEVDTAKESEVEEAKPEFEENECKDEIDKEKQPVDLDNDVTENMELDDKDKE